MENSIKRRTGLIAYIGILIALETVCRVYEISPMPGGGKVNLSFLPASLAASIAGSVWGGISSGAADLLYCLFAGKAPYPLFTLAAFIKGIIWGTLLYKKQKTLWRLAIGAFLTVVFIDNPTAYVYLRAINVNSYIIHLRLIVQSLYVIAQLVILVFAYRALNRHISEI